MTAAEIIKAIWSGIEPVCAIIGLLFAAVWIFCGLDKVFFSKPRPPSSPDAKTYNQLAAENAARHNEALKK